MNPSAVRFLKGHGTQNDFVLLPDPDGSLELSERLVRALCDRRAGLGVDGVIRVAPASDGGFLMDYRNADGSPAQMCGNGARVFARFLVDAGWQLPGDFAFMTRGGLRTARLGLTGDVSIGMGPATVEGRSTATVAGRGFPGTAVAVGNPHLVCLLDGGDVLDDLDLTTAPTFDQELFPDGVNIEFVQPVSAEHLRMRVFERGVGETRSCGTGTVAAAAALLAAGSSAAGAANSSESVTVDIPGGTVVVTFGPEGATLTGPAEVVAAGTIDPAFWARSL